MALRGTPVVAVVAASLWWIGVGIVNPGADITARGHEELLYSALFGAMVEVIAVPAAIVRMWRHPAMRTKGNIAATVAGALVIPVCGFLWLDAAAGARLSREKRGLSPI